VELAFLLPQRTRPSAASTEVATVAAPMAAEVPVWLTADELEQISGSLGLSRHSLLATAEEFALPENTASKGRAFAGVIAWAPTEPSPIAGHIDLLQYKFNTLYILDFKPRAAKEQKRKVATQLNLYALALAKRANLSLSEIRCAWFDEEDFFSSKPLSTIKQTISLIDNQQLDDKITHKWTTKKNSTRVPCKRH